MKVNQKAGAAAQEIENKKSRETGTKKSEASSIFENLGSSKPSAKVDVSDHAHRMQKATELAKSGLNDVDEAKVARLQKMIDEGSYKVDAEAVADRLVDEHSLMGS